MIKQILIHLIISAMPVVGLLRSGEVGSYHAVILGVILFALITALSMIRDVIDAINELNK